MQDRFDAYNDALSISDRENEELRTRLNSYEWQPIATFLHEDTKGPWTSQYLLAHSEKKWRRFGRFDRTLKRWYYSGTDERSQWSQIEGDAPTHWMRIPDLPKQD